MNAMHEIDYRISGDDMQFVEIQLDPQEAVLAEAGAMMFMDDGIVLETIFGDGTAQTHGLMGALIGAGKRVLTGESLFMTVFQNQSPTRRTVAFGAPYPGKILPVNLRELGGEGFIMERLQGDGLTFLHASGTLYERQLQPGETLRVDTGCLVALQPTVDYDIEYVGGIKTALFGGEGLFFARVRGPGKVWLQSLPFSRLAARIVAAAPQTGRGGREEGSILGGIGRVLDGDNR